MNYSNKVVINKPFNEVWKFFDNPENLKLWQPTLQSFEHMEGDAGKPGAKSKLTYQEGKRTIEMVETIIERRDPGYLKATYEVKGVFNINESIVKEVNEQSTEVTINSEFQFTGFLKYIAGFAKGMFTSKTQRDLELLKAAVEAE